MHKKVEKKRRKKIVERRRKHEAREKKNEWRGEREIKQMYELRSVMKDGRENGRMNEWANDNLFPSHLKRKAAKNSCACATRGRWPRGRLPRILWRSFDSAAPDCCDHRPSIRFCSIKSDRRGKTNRERGPSRIEVDGSRQIATDFPHPQVPIIFVFFSF